MEYFVGRESVEPYLVRRFEWIGVDSKLFRPNWSEVKSCRVFGSYLVAFMYALVHQANVFNTDETEMVLSTPDHLTVFARAVNFQNKKDAAHTTTS